MPFLSYKGTTNVAEEADSNLTTVAVLYTAVPTTLSVPAATSTTYWFITAIRTTLDTDEDSLLTSTAKLYAYALENKEALLDDRLELLYNNLLTLYRHLSMAKYMVIWYRSKRRFRACTSSQ